MYTITYEEDPSPEAIQTLDDGIISYAKQQRDHRPIEFFGFFIRDVRNRVKGGCNGDVLYGCLYVGNLWVEESLRGQGYGTKLMLAAEKFGKEHSCTFASVNTMDWEALDFYKKLGYFVEFERHGFEKNSVFYFLRKDFE